MQILSNFVEVICYILPKAENLRFKNILFLKILVTVVQILYSIPALELY